MTLGQRIQELRKGHGLSQEALGEKLGVSRQAVSRWEMDGAVPEVDKLVAMARLFDVSLNELLQVEGPVPELSDGGAAAGEPTPGPAGGGKERGRRLIPALSTLALLLGIAALVLSFGRETGELSDRLTQLELRISQLEADGALNWDRPLVADFRCAPEVQADAGGICCTFVLTAAQQVEGMEVELQVVSDRGTAYPVEMVCEAGSTIYTGELELAYPAERAITVSAIFRVGGAAYTRPLLDAAINESGWRGEVLWSGPSA